MLGQLTGMTGALVPASRWKSKATGDFFGPGLSERFSTGLAKARAVSASGQEIPAKALFGQSPGGRINLSGFAKPGKWQCVCSDTHPEERPFLIRSHLC